ncbi:MAG TPA: hypothetical protein VHM19_20365, partial [Polyangiales bacterium]|nr:hypothetical protein [Polyangiales bacterium]
MLTRVETQAVSVARAPIPAPVSAPASAPEPEPPASPALPSAVVAAAPELDPIDARYPLHGVAFHVLAQVYSEPSDKAEVIGYLRRGGTLRAKPGVKGRGCNTRWHELLGGGFVCAGRGFQLGTTPQTFTPSPAAPALQDDLPYAYEKTLGRDVPQYVHLPSEREERDTSAQLAQMKSATVAQASDLERKRESVELSAKAASTSKAPEATDEPQLPSLVRMVMQPGFYVSVDGHEQDGARSLTRTVRGAYVRTEAMTPVPVPRMHGVSLSGSDAFPLALNFHPASASYRRDASTGVLVRADTLSLMQAFSLTGQSLIQNGQRYLLARDGTW